MREKIKNTPVVGNLAKRGSAFWRDSKSRFDAWLFYRKNKNILAKNLPLHDKYHGKRCFIFACGPSINLQDLTVLNGEYSMSINNFFLHPKLNQINPTWHVFPPTHDPINDAQATAWFREADKIFPKNQKVFSALTDKYLIEPNGFFKERDLHYYLWGTEDISRFKTIRLDKPLPETATNVLNAVLIALALGFKKIYLLGVDHDWLLHPGRKQSHFYPEENDTLWKMGYRPENISRDLEWVFSSHLRTWRIHKKIKRLAELYGAEIVNLSPTTMLDVYPRKRLEDVLNDPRQ